MGLDQARLQRVLQTSLSAGNSHRNYVVNPVWVAATPHSLGLYCESCTEIRGRPSFACRPVDGQVNATFARHKRIMTTPPYRCAPAWYATGGDGEMSDLGEDSFPGA